MGGIGKMISGLIGGLFGNAADSPSAAPAAAVGPAPTPVAPPVMPVPDDKAVKLAARQRLAKQNAGRTSRESSILSEDTGADTLGG